MRMDQLSYNQHIHKQLNNGYAMLPPQGPWMHTQPYGTYPIWNQAYHPPHPMMPNMPPRLFNPPVYGANLLASNTLPANSRVQPEHNHRTRPDQHRPSQYTRAPASHQPVIVPSDATSATQHPNPCIDTANQYNLRVDLPSIPRYSPIQCISPGASPDVYRVNRQKDHIRTEMHAQYVALPKTPQCKIPLSTPHAVTHSTCATTNHPSASPTSPTSKLMPSVNDVNSFF